MQAMTDDTVIAHITHDDRPTVSSASSRQGATLNCQYMSYIVQTEMDAITRRLESWLHNAITVIAFLDDKWVRALHIIN